MVRLLVSSLLNGAAAVSPRLAGAVAFHLFWHPFGRARLRPAESAVHARAVREDVDLDGTRVVTYRWGDGARPVLLVHGWKSRASRYAALIDRLLEAGFSPVAFDAPGHGESAGSGTTIVEYAEIMRRLDQRHGPFEAAVAHSFGALSAFHALRGGLRAGKLVALGGVSEFGYLVERFAAGLGAGPRVRRELRRRIEHRFRAEPGVIWDRFSAGHADVPATVLVIHDEGDRVVALEQARLTADRHGARLVVTRGLGHSRALGDPATLTQITGFLQAEAEPAR